MRFDKPDESVYILVGLRPGEPRSEVIIDPYVLGAIRHSYLSIYCREKIKNNNQKCLQESVNYWARRYLQFEARLSPALRGFSELRLIEFLAQKEIASHALERDRL